MSADRRLVDAEARARIANDLDATLVVEAAAGTGKTTALVERILSLLRTGKATLRTLVAVTFTEKAAGEMKLRLRTEIEKARTKAASRRPSRSASNDALAQLEVAHIGTIHAFCADLLRERPVEAKVDPLFEVASEDESERLYDEAFTRWFQETLQAPGEGVARVLRRATRERDQDGPRAALRKAGRNLDRAARLPDAVRAPRLRSQRRARRRDRRACATARRTSRRRATRTTGSTKSLHEIERVVSEIGRREEMAGGARDHDGVEAELRQLVRYKGWSYTGGRTQWFNRAEGISMQQVRDERAEAKAELDRVLDAADADLAALLFRELWARCERRPPRDEGRHPPTTSSRRARESSTSSTSSCSRATCCATDASVRAGLQQRFTHLLVDEFQDTDPLQAEILLLLASDDPEGERSRPRERRARQAVPRRRPEAVDLPLPPRRRLALRDHQGAPARAASGAASLVHLGPASAARRRSRRSSTRRSSR